MKIKKIEIKNFKNISSKGLVINCNSSLNCFIGKNGVGKSAVFDAVKCLIEASNGIENIKKIFKEQSFVSLKSLRLNNDNNQKNVLIKVSFYDDSNIILEISFRKQDLIDNSPISLLALSEYPDRIKSPGGLCAIPAKFSLYCSHFVDKSKICELCQSNIKQIKVISADRMQEKRTDNNSCLGNNFLAAENESQIGRINGITGQKFHYLKMHDDRLLVKDDLINYDNICGHNDYYHYVDLINKNEGERPVIMSVSIYDESHGIRNDAIISDSITRRKPNIIFIDEPELYLHPQAKKALFRTFEDLSKQGIQIFYITHSSEFLSHENPENIHLFKNENEVKIFKGSKLIKDDNMENSLMEKIELNNAFFAENLIVVEGKSDKKVITEIIKRNNNNKIPEDFDITIIDCCGQKELTKIFDLYNKFNKKIFFLLDHDIRNAQPSLHNTLFNRMNEKIDFKIIFPIEDKAIKGKCYAKKINEFHKYFIFKDALETFFGYDYKNDKDSFGKEEIFKDAFYTDKKNLCDKIYNELKGFFIFENHEENSKASIENLDCKHNRGKSE